MAWQDESIPVNIDTGGSNKSDAPLLPKNRPREYLHVHSFRAHVPFYFIFPCSSPFVFLYALLFIGRSRNAGKKSTGAPCSLPFFDRSIEQTSFSPFFEQCKQARRERERKKRLKFIFCKYILLILYDIFYSIKEFF